MTKAHFGIKNDERINYYDYYDYYKLG